MFPDRDMRKQQEILCNQTWGLARGAGREVVWAQGVIGDGHRHQEHGGTREFRLKTQDSG
ncbi:hypothetical protein THER5_1979 [Bifidobacterium thermacidophilum subsp. thermacidophilum]|uniref:Uncharacterized protein n=1 Tax=Bifidobacterium thermacidophilum subsp. thermacidophilum TaxID=79262 RepID=A0A087E2H5_9BIFI|nr:hypothetical protein THER5_1979 [Bifidobacterium thermacidophilum subsp. thermacidophilum]